MKTRSAAAVYLSATPQRPQPTTRDEFPFLIRGLLSGAELKVLHLIGSGQSTRAIASVLHRSIKAIETYRYRVRAKLGLQNSTALAQTAWQFVHGAASGSPAAR